jgi:hypothetical protein
MASGPYERRLLPICCPPSKAKLRQEGAPEQARQEALMGTQLHPAA